jgi:ethanolamine utilization microcompartment shell protein EutL
MSAAMLYVERRRGETADEAASRTGVDAVYAARDAGGTMHDAGKLAGRAVQIVIGLHPGDAGIQIAVLP